MSEEKKIKLNEQELTQEEFDKKKAELTAKPGVTLVEVGENQYKTRIKG